MKEQNTAAITASLERSLRNCYLNHENGVEDNDDDDNKVPNGAVSVNSDISFPSFWEQQCLDIKTGDVYYKNYRNGVESTEDPRTAVVPDEYGGDFSSSSSSDGDSWYDSEDYSSSESSPSEDNNNNNHRAELEEENGNVLVVSGCKNCYMYFMVPKKAEACPKCNGHLLRFDRSLISSP